MLPYATEEETQLDAAEAALAQTQAALTRALEQLERAASERAELETCRELARDVWHAASREAQAMGAMALVARLVREPGAKCRDVCCPEPVSEPGLYCSACYGERYGERGES